MHVLPGVVPLYFLNKTLWWQRMHVIYSPFFLATPCGGKQSRRWSSSSCANMGLPYLASVLSAFLLHIFFFFVPSTFTVGYLRLFLVCYIAIPYVGQLNSPTDSPPLSLPSTLSSIRKSSSCSIMSHCSCYHCSCSWLQLPLGIAENSGRHWDAWYLCRNVKIRFEMYYFRNLCEQQWYHCCNNGSQRVRNGCELPQQ